MCWALLCSHRFTEEYSVTVVSIFFSVFQHYARSRLTLNTLSIYLGVANDIFDNLLVIVDFMSVQKTPVRRQLASLSSAVQILQP